MFKDIKKIMIDFDCTIVDTIKAIVDNYNEDFQYYKDFHHINWWEINTWDFKECACSTPEYINTYFNQPRFFRNMEYMDNAKEVIDNLREYFRITIVSSGYSPNLKLKEKWISEKRLISDDGDFDLQGDRSFVSKPSGGCAGNGRTWILWICE